MLLQIFNKPAFIEISVVIIAILGIILVLKDKKLSPLAKILWLIFVLLFNFIAVICYLIWKKMDKKEINCSNS
ncbi:MAG: PLDc N-terminal domain-containing protein [Bacteroidales bacterium]|nr:PLDc N-terminal domain-containing protein [Bacteroidales bacterium]